MIRQAISPRLAIRILLNTACPCAAHPRREYLPQTQHQGRQPVSKVHTILGSAATERPLDPPIGRARILGLRLLAFDHSVDIIDQYQSKNARSSLAICATFSASPATRISSATRSGRPSADTPRGTI